MDSDASDLVSYAYNAQGEEVGRQDQAGNVFESSRDAAGRITQTRVMTLASGFDGAVRRIETAYEALGRRETVTQYSATSGGTVLDQAGFSYDGWGNVETYRQDVDSVLGETTPEHEYEVSYTWAKATGGRNSLRRTGITLPSGASVSLDYRSVSGRFDDAVSRVTTLTHGSTVVVSYDYLGFGQVVGTDYPEPELRWRLYEGNTTGDYTDLDRFGRVVHSRWTKYGQLPFGMSPPNIYYVELGYDRNSNIVSAKDHVHAGFDVEYAMDDIDRLTLAKEGTLSGSSISGTPTRSQEWELDQVGNWNRDKLDLDGDGFYTGTDEWDDCRTHNDVNELLTRDLNCTSPVEHTLGYDAAGNLTDDGESYKYEYDAFYRLRFIKTQGDDVVSEHRYNGLGHRIAVHVDTDDDGDVDTWEHLAYDERWRLVAKFWEGASDPHEEYLHHQAGLDGHGGSSYIDLVALRDRDTDDNGSLDERIYYCQNWRADVSVLVSSSAELLEWVKYSAYGVPFGLPAGDADSDGGRDSADRTQIAAWASAPAYDVRGDLNLDGLVNSADLTLASGDVEMGRGVLSGVGNGRGYSGLIHCDEPLRLVARHRSMDLALGRWHTRDPLEYIDGSGLYEAYRSGPLANRDPTGQSTQAATDTLGNSMSVPHHDGLELGSTGYSGQSDYPPPDMTVPKETYNCAGLASRTYAYMSLDKFMEWLMRGPAWQKPCHLGCPAGSLMFYTWSGYITILYDCTTGGVPRSQVPVVPDDWHVVGAQVTTSGAIPTTFASKEGKQAIKNFNGEPILQSGNEWAPATSETYTSNDGNTHCKVLRRNVGAPVCYCRVP